MSESGEHIGVLCEEEQCPAECMCGGQVGGCEQECGVSGQLIIGHVATGFGSLHQEVQDIETI